MMIPIKKPDREIVICFNELRNDIKRIWWDSKLQQIYKYSEPRAVPVIKFSIQFLN